MSGDLHIAYQVFGEGPLDLVYAPGFISHVEMNWELPYWVNIFRRLSRFSRVIVFDKRGTGLSDRVGGWPTLEERMDDIRAVMDAAGSERAALIGVSEGGPMCMMFAALYPERASALMARPMAVAERMYEERRTARPKSSFRTRATAGNSDPPPVT